MFWIIIALLIFQILGYLLWYFLLFIQEEMTYISSSSNRKLEKLMENKIEDNTVKINKQIEELTKQIEEMKRQKEEKNDDENENSKRNE